MFSDVLFRIRRQKMASVEKNKDVVVRYVDAVNAQNYDAFDEMVVEDYVDHDPVPGQQPGLAGLKKAYTMFSDAFPDVNFIFEDVFGEGDLVVGRGVIYGTHKGSFMGVAPTGKHVRWTGTRLFRLNEEGKLTDGWINIDLLGLMQQLGAIPS
jgi:predicted ester cyclase